MKKNDKLVPELRFDNFKDDWIQRNLQEFSKISTGVSNREDSKIEGKYRFFDRSTDIRMSDNFLFDCEAIIVPGEGSKFTPQYYCGKFGLHQRVYSIMNSEESEITINWKFLFHNINKNKRWFLKTSVGSTVPSLRMNSFTTMKLFIPTLEEQERIGNFLSKVDKRIKLLEQIKDLKKQYKKGLLQQMFVSNSVGGGGLKCT